MVHSASLCNYIIALHYWLRSMMSLSLSSFQNFCNGFIVWVNLLFVSLIPNIIRRLFYMPLKFNQANALSLSLSFALSHSLTCATLLFACWVLFRAAIRALFYSLFALRALINNAEPFITLLLVKFKYLPIYWMQDFARRAWRRIWHFAEANAKLLEKLFISFLFHRL